MDREDFESAVAEALDHLPREFAELMSNVSIQVREVPDDETLAELDLDPRFETLFGLYTGVPLDQRGGWYGNVLPDMIVLYRQPLLTACNTHGQLVRQIQTRGSGNSADSRTDHQVGRRKSPGRVQKKR